MLVGVDLAQMEWRAAVQLSGDQVAYNEIVQKLDTHTLNQQAFNLPSRIIAKIYLFRTIFKGSGYAFANDPAFMHVSDSPKFWDNINEQFYKKYYGLDAKHKEWAEIVLRGEPLISPTGREWYIPLGRDNRGNIKLPWSILTNYPVQGISADVVMIYRLSLLRRLRERHIPALVISTIHDSVFLDVQKEYVDVVMRLMYECLNDLVENIRKVFKYNWIVPLDGEVKYGMNMLDMIKVTREELF